jgi:membrane protease YdiL (CAAX protease family)
VARDWLRQAGQLDADDSSRDRLSDANPINEAFQYLVGNRSALLPVLWSGTVVAAFGEETVMRGFLFERLGKLFGTSAGFSSSPTRRST